MKKIIVIMMILTLLSSLNIMAQEDEENIDIVVIHSYHHGYAWTYDNNEGLRDIILENYPNANIYTEYLDWKRFPETQILESKYEEFLIKYSNIDIDLILTTDDMALEFSLDNREILFHDAPIAFGGIVSHSASEIIDGRNNQTGVYEEMQLDGVFELMELLQPNITDIVYIYDTSESGIRTAESFDLAAENLGITGKYTFHDWHEKTYNEILNDIQFLEDSTAVMYFSYSSSIDGISKSIETFATEFSAVSSVPLYSNGEYLINHGILGGTFLSGYLQGAELGRLGSLILSGIDPNEIPHTDEATVYTGVDEVQMTKYNLDKKLLAKDIVIYNESFTFFEEYKALVIEVVLVISALVLFIIVLLYQQKSLRKSKKLVSDNRVELQALYEQVQASEEELIAQNKELQLYQENLKFEAYHDSLTKLPNRIALDQYVRRFLNDVNKTDNKVVVVFIDFDNFKFVNNTYGHQIGDEVLKTIAKRLSEVQEGIFASRYGGDEFVILKEYAKEEEETFIENLMLEINQTIGGKIEINEIKIMMKASIGYSIYPDDGIQFEELIVEADTAMFQAKKDGKSSIRNYNKEMSNVLKNEYSLIKSLKEACDNEEFYLMYQPIVSIDGKSITSFEALVRWNSPTHGFVAPNDFIHLAETSGLIIPLGYQIIDEALDFIKEITLLGDENAVISINVSVVQFYDEEFVDTLISKILTIGLKPSNIQIEITESVLIETYGNLIDKLHILREKGVNIALDDFGTGYSSLAYLHELPIDKLKIDKVFIDDIVDEVTKVPLVDATITLANSFGLEIIAEGVEQEKQLVYLRNRGCKLIQGYLFSRPLILEDAINYYKKINE